MNKIELTGNRIEIFLPRNLMPELKWVKKNVSVEELKMVRAFTKVREQVNPISAGLYVVRMDNWSHFATDFFLPTFMNYVKDHDCPFCCVGVALAYDILTFAIRVLTLIPRAIILSTQSEHPAIAYLKKENAPAAFIAPEQDLLRLRITTGIKSLEKRPHEVVGAVGANQNTYNLPLKDFPNGLYDEGHKSEICARETTWEY